MLILLTSWMLSIGSLSCSKTLTVVLVPVDPTIKVVQRLPNGNWEVTPAYIVEHTMVLAQRRYLIMLLKAKGVPVVEEIK